MRSTIFAFFIIWIQLTCGLYIKNTAQQSRNASNKSAKSDAVSTENDWNIFKLKLGLTNEKVELLKQQKDQPATVELLNRFIKENPSYTTGAKEDEKKPNTFLKLYHALLKKHKISKSTLRTSLNFVLGDDSKKNLRRPRRKIALNMISDMPSEKIDDLLKMFTTQHGIDESNSESDDIDDYNGLSLPALLPSPMNNDYLYENLYEDEEDLGVPARTHHNSEYGSFQDLILQASRNQWQREIEETKLRNQNNDRYV